MFDPEEDTLWRTQENLEANYRRGLEGGARHDRVVIGDSVGIADHFEIEL